MPGKKFDNYDFETEFQKSIEDMDDDSIRRMMESNYVSCLYRTRSLKCGSMLRVDIYPSFNHKDDQPPKEKKESSQSQRNLNTRKSIEHLIELINCNFGEGDYIVTLEYDKEHLPATPERADQLCKNYIKRLNARLKKIDRENVKYIFVTEFYDKDGEPVRVHHHMICRCDLPREMIEELWQHGSRTQVKIARPDKDSKWLSGWGNYITKANYEKRKGKRRWKSSKGLKKPIETKSYSKFSRRSVEKMVTHADAKEKIAQKFKGYDFIDCQIFWNEINMCWYVRAELIKSDWQQIRKRELEQRKKAIESASDALRQRRKY